MGSPFKVTDTKPAQAKDQPAAPAQGSKTQAAVESGLPQTPMGDHSPLIPWPAPQMATQAVDGHTGKKPFTVKE